MCACFSFFCFHCPAGPTLQVQARALEQAAVYVFEEPVIAGALKRSYLLRGQDFLESHHMDDRPHYTKPATEKEFVCSRNDCVWYCAEKQFFI